MDRYKIIPPLGYLKSLATSPMYVFAVSDNYLLVFDKQTLSLEKSFHFNKNIKLVGYDPQYNDVWVYSTSGFVRLSVNTYSMREYFFSSIVNRFGIGKDYLYIDGPRDYRLDKITGEVNQISAFPNDLQWHKRSTVSDIRNYAFLTPYHYYDELHESQFPNYQFNITSVYDDGMNLYVGTDRYGLLKYNKISWQKQKVVYGPLDSKIRRVKKFDDKIYFVSSSGISFYQTKQDNWKYHRFTHQVADLLLMNENFFVGFGHQIAQRSGGLMVSVRSFGSDIICLQSDNLNMYVGTNSGLYKIIRGTSEPIPFGPDRYAVHTVYPSGNAMFVGGEIGFYKYNKDTSKWSKILNRGIKDIVEVNDELFLLGVNNQLIKYQHKQENLSDTTVAWILLPYFNIYDIDADKEVLYCASYAGVYYYEPETEFYKVIYNLPRIKYDYVFVVDEDILAVSGENLFSLPIKFRD
jgi:hypothetical protein